jgi:hypothetical protein
MIHRPFMQVTLSTRPLGLEREVGVTVQYVVGKRRKKGKVDEAEEALEGAVEVITQEDMGDAQEAESAGHGLATAPVRADAVSQSIEAEREEGEEAKKRKTLSSQESRPVKRKKGAARR